MIGRNLFCFFVCLFLSSKALAQDSNLQPCPSGKNLYWSDCFGTYTYSNGNKYTGEWKNNKRVGKGIEYLTDGQVFRSGIWEQDRYVYPVKFDPPTVAKPNLIDKFTTALKVDLPAFLQPPAPPIEAPATFSNLPPCSTALRANWTNCFGSIKRPSGEDIYAGEWKNNQWSGRGTFTWEDGRKYVGEFKEFKQDGNGVLFGPNGTVISSGNWKDDKLVLSYPIDVARFQLPSVAPVDQTQNEKDRLATNSELEQARNKRRELEERLAQESKAREQERLAAEARAKEREKEIADYKSRELQRVVAEERAKEREKELLEFSKREQQRLADEARVKDAELAELRAQLEKSRQQPQKQAQGLQMARRRALIIGNDSYKSIQKLDNARADAKAIAESLTKVGYAVTLKTDLTEKEMKVALRTFKSQVEPGDEVAIFYAGHGIQLDNTNYLIPIDVAGDSPDQVKDEAIPLQRVLDDMTERKAKLTLALIDACRDNPFKSVGRSTGQGRGLAPTTAATGQMVVFSAGSGQQALDKLGPTDKEKNGLFTRVFIREIARSDRTVDAVVKQVRNEVVRLAKSVGHEQVPAIYDQVVGDFYFARSGQ
jgi:hypothetical protein